MTSLLRLDNLTLQRNTQSICQDLDLTIGPGEFWGILGKNGRGKSTLLHTMAGLIQPNHGCIRLNGLPLHQYSRRDIAQGVGILLQEESHIFPMTVQDTILSSRYMRKHLKTDWQALESLVETFDLQSLMTRQTSTLSGGEKNRVRIARILYQQPDIYLLDEPSQHLDPATIRHVMTHFRQLAEQTGCTIIMATHDMHLLQHTSHCLLMYQDNTVFSGLTSRVLNNDTSRAVYGIHTFSC